MLQTQSLQFGHCAIPLKPGFHGCLRLEHIQKPSAISWGRCFWKAQRRRTWRGYSPLVVAVAVLRVLPGVDPLRVDLEARLLAPAHPEARLPHLRPEAPQRLLRMTSSIQPAWRMMSPPRRPVMLGTFHSLLRERLRFRNGRVRVPRSRNRCWLGSALREASRTRTT